jgi:hypothetical protein
MKIAVLVSVMLIAMPKIVNGVEPCILRPQTVSLIDNLLALLLRESKKQGYCTEAQMASLEYGRLDKEYNEALAGDSGYRQLYLTSSLSKIEQIQVTRFEQIEFFNRKSNMMVNMKTRRRDKNDPIIIPLKGYKVLGP